VAPVPVSGRKAAHSVSRPVASPNTPPGRPDGGMGADSGRGESSPAAPKPPATEPSADRALFETLATEQDISRAEHDCGLGRGKACLRLWVTHEPGRGPRPDAARARRYLKLAVGMFVRQCNMAGAYGCYALSRMHAEGRGMRASERDAKALLDRSRMLCLRRHQPPCEVLFPDLSSSPDR
jgi:TPR repeat protein